MSFSDRNASARRFLKVSLLRNAAVEALEDRKLMASILVDATKELIVTGDSGKANTISVSLSADGKTVTAKDGALSKSYGLSGLRSVKVLGGALADSITIAGGIKLESWIYPNNGNDTINGGGGSDHVYEAGGNNRASLGDNNDAYEGGGGSETVYGGNGNDSMLGRGGVDYFYGEAGNDTFDGGDKTNTFDGGAGTDTGKNASTMTNVENGNTASSVTPTPTPTPTATASATGTSTFSGYVVNDKNKDGTWGHGETGIAGRTVYVDANNNGAFNAGEVTRTTASNGKFTFSKMPAGTYTLREVLPAGWSQTTPRSGGAFAFNVSKNQTLGGKDFTTVAGSTSTPTPTTPTPTTPTPTPTTPTPTPTASTAGGGIGAAAGGTSFVPAVADTAAVKPVAVISARQTTINAGAAVFVNALSSTLNAGTPTSARYEWDFGDGSGKYNKLVGFSAGHVYANAGTYTITLRLLNEKRGVATKTLTVNVQSAGRRAIYVSAAGSDSNDGSSATKAVKSISKAATLLRNQSNVELLLRRGDTFSQSTTLSLSGRNAKIGAYGSGTDPVLKWNGAKTLQNMVRIEEGSVGDIVQDITFDSIWPGPTNDRDGLPFAIKVNGNDSVLQGNTFLNVSYAIQTNFKPTGLVVQDNDAPSPFALRSYLLWGEGNDFVVLGNRSANVIAEHSIRIFGVSRILIAYNDLANPNNYSYEPSKNALNLQWADYAYVYGNTIRNAWQIGPLGNTEGLPFKSSSLQHVVIESNHAIGATMRIVPGAIDVVIRNNVIEKNDENAFVVDPYDSMYKRTVTNLTFANNTIINNGTRGRFLYVGGKASGITLVNNVYKADNLIVGTYGAAAVYVNDTSLGSFKLISNNVWPVPTMTPWALANIPGGTAINVVSLSQNTLANYYNIARWNTLGVVGIDGQQDTSIGSGFAPSASSTAANFATKYAGVFNDYSGKSRPISGSLSSGAVEV